MSDNLKWHTALTQINEIRNSIIGTQTVNWTAHVYPLVKALNEAGFVGEGYEISREKAKTLIEQRNEALSKIEQLTLKNKLEQSMKDELWKVCQSFIEAQEISCADAVYQTDRVIENACDFIEQVCEVVGYHKIEE